MKHNKIQAGSFYQETKILVNHLTTPRIVRWLFPLLEFLAYISFGWFFFSTLLFANKKKCGLGVVSSGTSIAPTSNKK